MHLRPMVPEDIPEIADISALAHLDDPVEQFVAPNRRKYYHSYRDCFVRKIHARRLRPGWIFLVAETDEHDHPTQKHAGSLGQDGPGTVVGYAAWLRSGSSIVAQKWKRINEDRLTKFELFLNELRNQFWTSLHLDWSENPDRRAMMTEMYKHTFPDDVFPDIWNLENVVVHPYYQRQGIGALLVKWGQDQATAERIPCGVESGLVGLRLYEKAGFVQFDEIRYGQAENETMRVMLWEPKDMKDHWIRRWKEKEHVKNERTGSTQQSVSPDSDDIKPS